MENLFLRMLENFDIDLINLKNILRKILGVHRLGCRNAAGERTRRHDDVVAVIADAALAADPRAFRVAREERLQDAENSQSRPGVVALDLGSGRTLVDVTIASPFEAAG